METSDWIALGALFISGASFLYSRKSLNENKRANDIAEKALKISFKEHHRNLENDLRIEEKNLKIFIKLRDFGENELKTQYYGSFQVVLSNGSMKYKLYTDSIEVFLKVNSEDQPNPLSLKKESHLEIDLPLISVNPGDQKSGVINFEVEKSNLPNSDIKNCGIFVVLTENTGHQFQSNIFEI